MALLKKPGKLVIISGFSGVGKGTVVQQLIGNADHYALSVSMTTRQPRENEEHGVHYYFVKDEVFEDMIEKNGFLEHAGYVGNYYGTPKAYVDRKLEEGFDVILEIEIQGALNIKKKVPEAILIYMLPPSAKTLKERLTGRGTETEEVILKRMKRAAEEAAGVEQYDYIIVNEDADECAQELNCLIRAQRLRASSNMSFIRKIQRDLKELTKEGD